MPYFITEALTERVIHVHFDTLDTDDEAELRGETWSQAVFAEVWPQFVNVERTLKLVRIDEQDRRVQGLVHMGNVEPNGGFLANSLIEVAPYNRYGVGQQIYRGVGRVLIARLVLESFAQGGHGRVLVLPRPGTEPFYKRLGFMSMPPLHRRFAIDTPRAVALLQTVLVGGVQIELLETNGRRVSYEH